MHHAKAYRGRKVVFYVRRNRTTHTARKVCRPLGGYSHLTVRDVLWGRPECREALCRTQTAHFIHFR
jgi:hypothetical protein